MPTQEQEQQQQQPQTQQQAQQATSQSAQQQPQTLQTQAQAQAPQTSTPVVKMDNRPSAQVQTQSAKSPDKSLLTPQVIKPVEPIVDDEHIYRQAYEKSAQNYSNAMDRSAQILRDAADRYEVEDEAARKKRERTERSRRVISAVSDGIRALANLWFTTKYAPNMYDESQSLLTREDALQEKLKKLRDDNQEAHDKAMERAAKLEAEKSTGLQDLAEKYAKGKNAREEVQRKRALFPLQYEKAQYDAVGAGYKADKAMFDANKAEVQADNEPLNQQKQQELLDAKTNKERQAAKHYRDMDLGKARTFCGETYYNADDYKRAVKQKAAEYGIPYEQEMGTAYGSHKSPRDVDSVAAEVQSAWEEEQEGGWGSTL